MASWTTPAELAQPLPRRTRMSRAFVLSAVSFPVALGLFGLMFVSVHPAGRPVPSLFVIIPCAMLPFMGSLLLSLLLKYRRQRGLVRWGRVTQATVTDKREIRTTKRQMTVLTYHFVDGSGRTVEGHWRGDSVRRMGEGALESPLVLFDANNSRRNTLYPTALVDCVVPAHP